MFESFIRSVKSQPEPTKVSINIGNSVILNMELFKDKLRSIDSLPDRELFDLIKHSYPMILEDIFINNNVKLALDVFTHPKFLTVLNQVLSNSQLTHSQKIYCNKLAYDYLTFNQEKDEYVKQLLFILSKTVNKDVIPGLLGLDLPEDLASYLALSRFSSTKETTNVKRVNFIIINAPIELMTEQRIVWIYEKLFNNLTPLVEGVMFDVYEEDEFNENQQAREIYSLISLALLDILNAAPSDVIRKVLISYSGDSAMLYSQKPTRFSMNALSSDYDRIQHVIECLKTENVYVL